MMMFMTLGMCFADDSYDWECHGVKSSAACLVQDAENFQDDSTECQQQGALSILTGSTHVQQILNGCPLPTAPSVSRRRVI